MNLFIEVHLFDRLSIIAPFLLEDYTRDTIEFPTRTGSRLEFSEVKKLSFRETCAIVHTENISK
jgi:hypothetical protein